MQNKERKSLKLGLKNQTLVIFNQFQPVKINLKESEV